MMSKFFSEGPEDIDAFFGLEINQIEHELLRRAQLMRPEGDMNNWGEALHHGNQTWVGLHPQTLNTPYQELSEVLEFLGPQKGEVFVDLGAGYGRLGLVLQTYNPDIKFLGYEFVPERVHEGNRVLKKEGCLNAQLIQQDLMDENFNLPPADYYFIYDFGKTSHIRETLKRIEAMGDEKKFSLIARGKGVRSMISLEHPWLSLETSGTHYSIYSF